MLRNLAIILGLAASPAFATGLEIEIAGEANGVVKIDLLEDIAPKHVEQIAALAAEGQYDDVVFHRVIEGFMAQTGDVQTIALAIGSAFSIAIAEPLITT